MVGIMKKERLTFETGQSQARGESITNSETAREESNRARFGGERSYQDINRQKEFLRNMRGCPSAEGFRILGQVLG
jgi:hypothetical protein